ncbi:MAG TPA: hypothetical protein VI454_04800 [Verrucomicrobiae bacterium]|jgi:hypothetical protein
MSRYNTETKLEKTTAESVNPPAAGVKKVSFGGITKKKEESRTAYPVLPDPNGEHALIAARIIERTEQFDALKGALETDKAELRLRATLPFFQLHHGKHDVPSSLSVPSPAGEVLVTFQNRYGGLESDAALVPILGETTGKYFRQKFELKIDGDKLPEAATQELLDGLQALFAKHNALDALSVSDSVKPVTEFHAARHLILTPEQNVRLNDLCPIVAMIKTKGRK